MLMLIAVMAAVMIFVVGVVIGATRGTGFAFSGASPMQTSAPGIGTPSASAGINQALVNDVLRRLRSEYYGEIPADDVLTDGALRGMVSTLGDPFTSYVEPKFAKILEENQMGEFEGIGATLKRTNSGAIQIVRVYADAPAGKAGIQNGDFIEAVNGTRVTGLNPDEVAAMIRGPRGTEVTLSLRHATDIKPYELKLTRAKVVIPITESHIIGEGERKIAYVALNEFSQTASDQLTRELQTLLKENPKGVVFDLRDDGGGLLDQAVKVGDQFLREGVIVIQRNNKGTEEKRSTTNSGIAQDIPLVVLVNGGTASASEIVAGAIQDYKRGTLIGETTFGKGSVQLPERLANGAQLRITIQRWFTPNNRAIHGVGITPDYVVKRTLDDEQAGRDPQLDAAVKFLLDVVAPSPTN